MLELDDTLRELEKLAQLMSRELEVHIKPGFDSWSYQPDTFTLTVNVNDLRQNEPDYCAGLIAHEIGHFYISRYAIFESFRRCEPWQASLMNALEDYRSDLWIMDRYPGAARWLRTVYQDSFDEKPNPIMPLAMQFMEQCAREPERHWVPETQLAEPVRQALEETRAARQSYVDQRPRPSIVADEVFTEYRDRVYPDLIAHERGVPVSAKEAEVRTKAWQAFSMAREQIFPACAALLEEDRWRLGQSLTAHSRMLETRQATARGLRQLFHNLMQLSTESPELTEAPSREMLELAGRILEAIFQRTAQSQSQSTEADGRPAPRAMPISGARTPARPPRTVDDGGVRYQQLHNQLRGEIRKLTRELRQCLVPSKKMTKRSGYREGVALDMRKLFLGLQTPSREPDFWIRRTNPTRRTAAFSLLIDCSGSMRGRKISAALKASVAMAETFKQLSIPFAVNGFQDILIPVHSFQSTYGNASRKALADLQLEVTGERPGGNNGYHFNDDGPCLLEASHALLNSGHDHHILIMISDGLPEGRRSSKVDLVNTIRSLQTSHPNLSLIGLGIGPNTGHVNDLFEHGGGNIAIRDFPTTLASILKKQLRHLYPTQGTGAPQRSI